MTHGLALTNTILQLLLIVTAGVMAGDSAPPLYLCAPQRECDALVRHMSPVEAGIVGDVSVTVWHRASDVVAE